MPTGEHEAIVRLQRGDISGLEMLVHAYQARAVRCAFLVVQDHALALDVAQAAFATTSGGARQRWPKPLAVPEARSSGASTRREADSASCCNPSILIRRWCDARANAFRSPTQARRGAGP